MVRLDIFWRGQCVGVMEDPRADSFHLYGSWRPKNSAYAKEFVASYEAGEEIEVKLNNETLAVVAVLGPGDQIEMTLYPSPSPRASDTDEGQ